MARGSMLQRIHQALLRHSIEGKSRVARYRHILKRCQFNCRTDPRVVAGKKVTQRLPQVEVLEGRRVEVVRERANTGGDLPQLRLGVGSSGPLYCQPSRKDPGDHIVMEFPGDAVPLLVLRCKQVASPPFRFRCNAMLVPSKHEADQCDQGAGSYAADDKDPSEQR